MTRGLLFTSLGYYSCTTRTRAGKAPRGLRASLSRLHETPRSRGVFLKGPANPRVTPSRYQEELHQVPNGYPEGWGIFWVDLYILQLWLSIYVSLLLHTKDKKSQEEKWWKIKNFMKKRMNVTCIQGRSHTNKIKEKALIWIKWVHFIMGNFFIKQSSHKHWDRRNELLPILTTIVLLLHYLSFESTLLPQFVSLIFGMYSRTGEWNGNFRTEQMPKLILEWSALANDITDRCLWNVKR